MPKCPGQDRRFWTPSDVFDEPCPQCGAEVEFFKDDPFVKCHVCGRSVRNPRISFGCAEWCKFADQCLGLLPGASSREVGSICQRLIEEMRAVFGDDGRRIDHALAVLNDAETILESEEADPLVVRAAAILHDIGIHEAERKHGSSAARYQEEEGPPIARAILDKAGISDEAVDHVCRIVGSHHSRGDVDTPEFRVVYDADLLVNMREAAGDNAAGSAVGESVFLTSTGRKLAGKARSRAD